MRRNSVLLLIAAIAVLGGCTDDGAGIATSPSTSGQQTEGAQTGQETTGGEGTEVSMTNAEGASVGTVTLTPEGNSVRVRAELEGLQPGFHGFHIHDVGLCEPGAPDGPFTTAKGHYVGEGGGHGDHDGDMPSLYVRDDGTASMTVTLDTFTVEELTAGDGAAVMVHASSDNFANIPNRYTAAGGAAPGPDQMTTSTGDAGARVACGVVDPAQA